MARAGLRDIVSLADRAAVMGLRRGPGQDQYLDSMEEIFGEADEQQRAMPRPWAVHDAETGALVGFAMISDNIPQPMDDDLVGPYYLWKLLIDHRCRAVATARRHSTRSRATSRRGPAMPWRQSRLPASPSAGKLVTGQVHRPNDGACHSLDRWRIRRE